MADNNNNNTSSSTSSSHQPLRQISKSKSKPKHVLIQVYLIIYNGLQLLGWAYLLLRCIYAVTFDRASILEGPKFWQSVMLPLKAFQALAIVEILHSAMGLISASAFTSAMQIFSRLFIVFEVCDMIDAPFYGKKIATAPYAYNFPLFTFIVVLAWCIIEVVRYSFYVVSLMQKDIAVLSWLRYSLFLALYPIGILFELICCYIVVKFLSSNSRADSDTSMALFPDIRISLRYCIIAVMISYIPGAPILFNHMLKNRKKKLKNS